MTLPTARGAAESTASEGDRRAVARRNGVLEATVSVDAGPGARGPGGEGAQAGADAEQQGKDAWWLPVRAAAAIPN